MIYLLLAAGFEESEALVPLDLLRRAGLTVKTVAITADPVTGSHGVTVLSDINADAATEPIDLLILPGGMPGTKNLDASPHVDRLLENTQSDGGRIAAICAALWMFTDLLQNRPCRRPAAFRASRLPAPACR